MSLRRRVGKRAKGKEPKRPYQLVLFGANTPVGQQVAKYIAQYIPEHLIDRWAVADVDAIPLMRLHVMLEKFRYGLGKCGDGIGALRIDDDRLGGRWARRWWWSSGSGSTVDREGETDRMRRREDGEVLVDDSDPYEELVKKRQCTLDEMCAQTVLLLNCASGLALCSAVVEACARHDVDYLDLSMDDRCLSAVRARYHEAALAKGLFIVQGCVYSTVCLDAGLLLAVLAQETEAELEGRAAHARLAEVSCFCSSSDGPSLVINGPAGRGMDGGLAMTRARPLLTRWHDVVGQWVVQCSSVEEQILCWSWSSRCASDVGARPPSHPSPSAVAGGEDGTEDAPVHVRWSVASESLVDSLWIYLSLLCVYYMAKVALVRALLALWLQDSTGDSSLSSAELYEAKVVCTFAEEDSEREKGNGVGAEEEGENDSEKEKENECGRGKEDGKESEKLSDNVSVAPEEIVQSSGVGTVSDHGLEPGQDGGGAAAVQSVSTCATMRSVASTSTAVAAVACCLCLLHDRAALRLDGGWQTPTNAFGTLLIDRLEMAGVDIITGSTPPPPLQAPRHYLASGFHP